MKSLTERIKGNKNPEISVIVPAFNVEKYISKCINSILNQSFSNFEIIIVDDGSTDETGSICRELERSDNRIKYVKKENEGQGRARNIAVKMSHGKWLAFVDSDDWINSVYLENLYVQAEKTNSDIVVCDYIEHDNLSECEIRKSQEFGTTDSPIVTISPAFWAKLWLKSLFEKNNIEQPSFYFEDIAVVPFLIANASKITYSAGSEYYYVARSGSTVKKIDTMDDRVSALYFLIELFVKHNLFNRKRSELKEFVIQRCQADMLMAQYFLEERFYQVYKDHDTVLKKYFQSSMNELKKRNEFVWGSYNTYRVAHYINRIEITHRYMASSIISAVSPVIEKVNQKALIREVPLREENVIRDCTKKFMHMNPAELKHVEIILVDFLDERFSVACEGSGYITLSDAYLEEATAYIPSKTLEIEDRDELWYAACDKFIIQLENCFSDKKIFLIRMKLAEHYGDTMEKKLYEEIDRIRKINIILDNYYDYFTDKCRNVISIYVQGRPDYYTDKEFRHGCYPWHLNEEIYQCIGKEIMQYMERDS